jgi:hypothetical protein
LTRGKPTPLPRLTLTFIMTILYHLTSGGSLCRHNTLTQLLPNHIQDSGKLLPFLPPPTVLHVNNKALPAKESSSKAPSHTPRRA